MNPMPAAIGQTFRSTFRGMTDADHVDALYISLSCKHVETVPGTDEDSVYEDILWTDKTTRTIRISPEDQEMVVPFSFEIPGDLPPSYWQYEGHHRVHWSVKIQPLGEEEDAHVMEFDIPVMLI